MVAAMMPEMPVGAEFKNWPLHMTILSWFQLPREHWQVFDQEMREYVILNSYHRPVIGGETDHFETPEGRVQIRKLSLESHVRYVTEAFWTHASVYQLAKVYGTIEDETYMGVNWHPHVSAQPDVELQEGQELEFTGLSVIQKDPERGLKIIKALYRWGIDDV